MSSTPHDPFYSSPFGPFYRRHTPYMVQPEYRIYEMNKRLQSRTELWIPPAFGCRPEYDNGLEEIVFGFEPWIIVVNLAMPFSIFYRMHAAASLFEVYCKI